MNTLTKEVKKIEEVQKVRKSQRKKKKKNQKSILIKIVFLINIFLLFYTILSSLVTTNRFYRQEIELKNKIIDAQAKTIEIYAKPQTQLVVKEDKTDLGQFKLTFYCACKKCCGPNAKGITATGTKVEEGRTIAVDPKVIKLGSTVEIEGFGTYIAEDTGSAIKGKIIDIYLESHEEALHKGVQYANVYVKGE